MLIFICRNHMFHHLEDLFFSNLLPCDLLSLIHVVPLFTFMYTSPFNFALQAIDLRKNYSLNLCRSVPMRLKTDMVRF